MYIIDFKREQREHTFYEHGLNKRLIIYQTIFFQIGNDDLTIYY